MQSTVNFLRLNCVWWNVPENGVPPWEYSLYPSMNTAFCTKESSVCLSRYAWQIRTYNIYCFTVHVVTLYLYIMWCVVKRVVSHIVSQWDPRIISQLVEGGVLKHLYYAWARATWWRNITTTHSQYRQHCSGGKKMEGFWSSGQVAFLDIRVFHPRACPILLEHRTRPCVQATREYKGTQKRHQALRGKHSQLQILIVTRYTPIGSE